MAVCNGKGSLVVTNFKIIITQFYSVFAYFISLLWFHTNVALCMLDV